MQGLEKILLDIDKAIKIVRETEQESQVIPNLMIGFGIDEIQAEYVAEIKLRHLNREYILKRTAEIEELLKEIEDMESVLKSRTKLLKIIIKELEEVSKKYGAERKTEIVSDTSAADSEIEVEVDESPVTLFFTKEGYFKKITPQSLRMSGEQKLKEGDKIVQQIESNNAAELLFFSDNCQVYKAKTAEFDDSKASILGDFIPGKLEFDQGESAIYMAETSDYKGYMIFVFENGKISKVPLSAYETKTNRKKLIKAYCDKYGLHTVLQIKEETELLLKSTNGRMLIVNTAAIPAKITKDNGGVADMTQKKGQRILEACLYDGSLSGDHRYRTRNLPAAGSKKPSGEDAEQVTLDI